MIMKKSLSNEFALRKIGRLALRVEGSMWVAYYAMPNTMDGAIMLAMIQMALILDPDRKKQFMDLMRDCVGDIIADATGTRPEWPDPPQPAPEQERAK